MTAVLAVEFRVKPEHVEAFSRCIADNAQSSLRNEKGCIRFDVCRDPQDRTAFFLYEIYADAAAVAAHLAAPHYKAFDGEVAPWVVSKSVRRLVLEPGESQAGAGR